MTQGELVYTVHHCLLSCDHYSYQKTLHQMNNAMYGNEAAQDDPNILVTSAQQNIYFEIPEHDGRNNPTHHGGHSDTHSTLAEGEATVNCSGSHHADTTNEGLVYSAVVVKDDKKTTIKTTAQTSSTSDTVTVL